jgi:hypothetical protein
MTTENSRLGDQRKTLEDMLFGMTTPIYINYASTVTGSGFFFKESPHSNKRRKIFEDIWLVTNRHVLFGNDLSRPGKLLEIRFKTRKKLLNGLPSWNILKIDRKELKRRIRVSSYIDEDVAVVKITDKVTEHHPDIDRGYGFFAVGEALLPEKAPVSWPPVEAGDDVIVVGYPHGQFDEQNLFPIVKSGCIATKWGAYVNGSRHFLLDRKLFPGSSGSVVITKPTILGSILTKQFLFLGVYEGEYNINYFSTAGKVWYGSLVSDIISKGVVVDSSTTK